MNAITRRRTAAGAIGGIIMTTIQRFDPFRELRRVNRLMPAAFPAPFLPAAGAAGGIPMDVRRSEGQLTVAAALPGFAPDEVDVCISPDRVLTVKATRQAEAEQPGGEYLLRERRYGSCQRALRLPADLDLDGAAVSLEHGVLTVTVPAAEAGQTRRLPIASPATDNPAADASPATDAATGDPAAGAAAAA